MTTDYIPPNSHVDQLQFLADITNEIELIQQEQKSILSIQHDQLPMKEKEKLIFVENITLKVTDEQKKFKLDSEQFRQEKEILEHLNTTVAQFTKNLHQAQIQFEVDNERLRRLTNYLHRQEQLELELHQAYKVQITTTDQAQNRLNQTIQLQKEIEQTVDKVLHEQQQTEVAVEHLKDSLSTDESKLTWLKGTLAASFLSPIAGAIISIPMINKISACKTDINKWKNQLNTAEKKLLQAIIEHDRLLDALDQAHTEEIFAQKDLLDESENLNICKTNWKNQISVINLAKLAVNEQDILIINDREQMKSIQCKLDTTREDQLQQAIKVNRIQIQLNTKNEVLQLKQNDKFENFNSSEINKRIDVEIKTLSIKQTQITKTIIQDQIDDLQKIDNNLKFKSDELVIRLKAHQDSKQRPIEDKKRAEIEIYCHGNNNADS